MASVTGVEVMTGPMASVVAPPASIKVPTTPKVPASPKVKATPKRLPSQRAPPRMSSSIARPKTPKAEAAASEAGGASSHHTGSMGLSKRELGIETASTTTPEDGSEASEPVAPRPPPRSCLKHADLTRALLSAMTPSKSVVWGDLPCGEGAHSKWSEGGRRWIKAKYVQKSRKGGSSGGKKDKAAAPTPRYAMTEVERAEQKLAKILARAERTGDGDSSPAPGTRPKLRARGAGSPSGRRAAKGGSGSQSDRATGSAPPKAAAAESHASTERGRASPTLLGGSGSSVESSSDSSFDSSFISDGSDGSSSSGGGGETAGGGGEGATGGGGSGGAPFAANGSAKAPEEEGPTTAAEATAQAAVRAAAGLAMESAQASQLRVNVFSMLFGEAGPDAQAAAAAAAAAADAKQMMMVVDVTDGEKAAAQQTPGAEVEVEGAAAERPHDGGGVGGGASRVPLEGITASASSSVVDEAAADVEVTAATRAALFAR